MNGGRTKPRIRATPTEAVQKNLLAASPHKGAEIPQSPVNGGLAREATPVQTAKTRLDAISESDLLPAKRTRLTRTGARRPRVEEAEQADQTIRQHPKPKPPKRRDTSLPEPKVEGQEQVPPATRPRKRQIDSEGDDDEHELKRARLTRKNLALFNKMGRKKVGNGASASALPNSTDGESTKTTSTTSSGFAIQAYKNGILDLSSSRPPANLGAIHERHARSRETASPPQSAYDDYVDRVEEADNEATMVFEVGGKLLKEYPRGYKRVINKAFTGFPKDVGFNNGLSAPQPDFVEGVRMQEYRPFPVDEHVDGAVLYRDNPGSVTLPHLAGEWKGPGKDMDKAGLQAGYDGAALVYARNQALSYLGTSNPPGHAEVTTFTTDGTNINFYAHYAAPSEDNDALEYHRYQYASANVKDTHQGHKDGRRGLRNQQDHAREQSYALKDQLKGHWKQRRDAYQLIAEEAPLGDIPEEPLLAQETNSYPDEDGEVEEPHPPAEPTRHKRTSRKAPPARRTDLEEPPLSAKSTRHGRTSREAPPARGTDDRPGHGAIDRPSYAPTPPPSSEEPRRSTRLSNARQLPSYDSAHIIAK